MPRQELCVNRVRREQRTGCEGIDRVRHGSRLQTCEPKGRLASSADGSRVSIVLGMMVLAILIVCCILCCFLMIPYVGAVVLLPITMFKRAYSLYYLAQYGPSYNVFQPAAVTQ